MCCDWKEAPIASFSMSPPLCDSIYRVLKLRSLVTCARSRSVLRSLIQAGIDDYRILLGLAVVDYDANFVSESFRRRSLNSSFRVTPKTHPPDSPPDLITANLHMEFDAEMVRKGVLIFQIGRHFGLFGVSRVWVRLGCHAIGRNKRADMPYDICHFIRKF